ncbi:hypothetical protein QTH90_12570 [Variovorax sp. J2P1-59]|uniref:hypothetical protein n=1 Tax=Variovorax flavidus TaxID=3053501 RepID=UPI002574C29E|nr:hypothetical protein [Variovorax sp. J2P1-59]MDM0075224.1 hypothetical protein [Variovorax sp. J2P1-59]
MNLAFDAEVRALELAAATARRSREQAHDRIVLAFRDQLQRLGPGPSDDDLQSFARLALVEQALRTEFGRAVVLAEELRTAELTQ